MSADCLHCPNEKDSEDFGFIGEMQWEPTTTMKLRNTVVVKLKFKRHKKATMNVINMCQGLIPLFSSLPILYSVIF